MEMQAAGPYAHFNQLAGGVWMSLISAGAGLAVAIPTQAAHNYLVNRVNLIVLDMERASNEIMRILWEGNGTREP